MLLRLFFPLICTSLMLSGCGSDSPSGQGDDWLHFTSPVLFGKEIGQESIKATKNPYESAAEHLAQVRLIIENIPADLEGRQFTLIGGGLDGTGFHGPVSTSFEGDGYHFAHADGYSDNDNPLRDATYKQDFTRTVINGTLEFNIYYQPTDITEWGERYNDGTELALTLMHAYSDERVLHATNNEFNWAFGGIATGESAEILLDLE